MFIIFAQNSNMISQVQIDEKSKQIDEQVIELEKKYSCKVHGMLFVDEASEKFYICFIREPHLHEKLNMLDGSGMGATFSNASIVLENCLLKESDDIINAEDAVYLGAIKYVNALVEISPYKELEDSVELSDKYKSKVHHILVAGKHDVYIKEPSRSDKLRVLDAVVNRGVFTAASGMLESCLLKVESDENVNEKNHSMYISCVSYCVNLIQFLRDQYKKK